MLPEATGLGQHFQARGHSFSLYGPTLSQQITSLFFPAVNWLTNGFVYATLSLDWLTKTSKYSIEFTYSDFPCHLKVNREKLALINRRWKCKKGKRLTITANFRSEISSGP